MPRRYRLMLSLALLLLVVSSIGQSLITHQPINATQSDSDNQSVGIARLPKETRFELPMRISPVLSGNFGEVRSNHYHSGIDFKTNQTIGKPIYAVASGWISRIRIGAYGFGYAIYLDHPSGYTSVYGHLDRYAPFIDSLVKAQQYARESFELDTLYPVDRYPIESGQLIAYSGNSGSSTAPHLHFEIRETKSEEILDPLMWYADRIPDKRAPRIQEVTVFALEPGGAIKGGLTKKSISTVLQADGNWVLKDTFPAVFGQLGLGIKAYDYMDQTTNLYGVCAINLYKNDSLLFAHRMDRFAFSDTRYVNAQIDYERWRRTGNLVLRSYMLSGNRWPNFLAKDKGTFQLSAGETARFRYVLSDRKGNETRLDFVLKGEVLSLRPVLHLGEWMDFRVSNAHKETDWEVLFPAGSLMDDLSFTADTKPTVTHSVEVRLHDENTPLFNEIPLSVRITNDVLAKKKAYYLAKRSASGHWQFVSAGAYSSGWLTTFIKNFGTFTVLADTLDPKITPINSENAAKNRLFRIRVSDNATGIASWRGTIDGDWVLFNYVARTGQLVYVFDDNRLSKKRQHTLVLTVSDACGNVSTLNHSFYY